MRFTRINPPDGLLRAARRLLMIVGAGLLGLALYASAAYSAANTVASSRSGSAIIAANPNQFKPIQCAGLNLTGLVDARTNNGSGGNDLVLGGPGNDVISGKNGSDCIVGGAGADTIKGQGGSDVILGGPGDDIIDGGPDIDFCYGEAGNDTLDCENTFQ